MGPAPLVTVHAAAHASGRCANAVVMKKDAPRPVLGRTLFVVFLLSFAPYFLPYEKQPDAYHDGKTMQERRHAAAHRRMRQTFDDADFGKVGDF